MYDPDGADQVSEHHAHPARTGGSQAVLFSPLSVLQAYFLLLLSHPRNIQLLPSTLSLLPKTSSSDIPHPAPLSKAQTGARSDPGEAPQTARADVLRSKEESATKSQDVRLAQFWGSRASEGEVLSDLGRHGGRISRFPMFSRKYAFAAGTRVWLSAGKPSETHELQEHLIACRTLQNQPILLLHRSSY
ncbi:hypothetical protein CPB84DRAFT_1823858 [Gymnopilus junonius]|uniref:Uncharacterized protein n=1 Tax=Gymnopilus junonius TaxID=109634 RepID=A0A9P5TPV5_GYMJU|nr:hypothetical protein CPB84DRAFT_1823858 [Gymnopilus junonius]